MHTQNLYRDIQKRTGGEIYIGVVGPVRTGKSTFIKRFMDLLVLPYMTDEAERMRAQDELPQSSGGKTITTTEPKFIPQEAAQITLGGDVNVNVRLVDCVGFMVEGAAGHMEDDAERLVKTPWSDVEIPFTQAAEIGTKKVINDHSTIGIVVTTDGSIGELKREAYIPPEEKTIQELKKLHKPFLVLVNSERPHGDEAVRTAAWISEKYHVTALPVNCEQLKKDDINQILESVLYEFPVTMIEFYMPKWVEMLPNTHKLKADLIEKIRAMMNGIDTIRDVIQKQISVDSVYIKRCIVENISMADGSIRVVLDVDDKYYYEMLSDLVGETIGGEYQLISVLKEMAAMRREYTKVLHAMESVRLKGYGVVMPERDEISLEKPELIRHGNKFGVKIKAESPSIHMIKANVITEIAPIVGTQQQAEDLIGYISDARNDEDGIWETNIFGKTVEQLVNDGITNKISMIGDECQVKLQETMQKIVNDSNGGMVCIII
ncbi:MAG TPA: stage IV sporulation protein A [Candidatus Eisenbergiella stercoravium]|nr:stage IV sporulation protein A [Candidatus Eisenbergiella stercoravium]